MIPPHKIHWTDILFFPLVALNILGIYKVCSWPFQILSSFSAAKQGPGFFSLLIWVGPLLTSLLLSGYLLKNLVQALKNQEVSLGGMSPFYWVLLYDFLFLGAFFVLFPFFWMFLTALKPAGEAFGWDIIPVQAGFDSFVKVWEKDNFGHYFFNSLWVGLLSGFFVTLFSAMAGYVFAKREFPFKTLIFQILMATMMIPGMMYMVPQFFIVFHLGWHNTFLAIIIPHLANVFGVFMTKQFMETIPDSLIESARLDGASEWQIFKLIILPLCMPILATLFLLTFLFHWSNFLWQLIVTVPESSITTLPVALALFKGQHSTDWPSLMAASCFSIFPIAVLFLLAQQFFIEGMTRGAVKG